MCTLTMPLCIFTLLSLFLLLLLSASSYLAGSAYTLTLISAIRTIASSIRTVTEYIISVILLILGLATSFILIVLFFHIMQDLLSSIPSGHFILHYLEKRVKAQLKALHLEEKKASRLIQEHLVAIDQWDEANNQLLNEIRAAKTIIQNKGWDWNMAPDRDPRSKTLGSTFFVHGPWSPRPREEPKPSVWCLVRWLRNEKDPRVWAAKAKVTHENGVLSDKRAVLARLQGENDDLFAKRDETIRKRNAVQWGPCQPKPTDTWAAKQLSLLDRPGVPYQPAPVHIQTNPFRPALDFTDQRLHFCEFCGKHGHRWTCQYDSLVTAKAAPYERPCPAFLARPKARPFFVSSVPAGRPSFFDPDPIVAPQGPQCWPDPAPAPQPAALTFFPPPASLFSAPPAPLVSASSAPLVPAKATASSFPAPQVRTYVQSASAPVTAPPPVPQASHPASLFTQSAAPIARSTTPPSTPPSTPPPRPAAPAPSTTTPYTPPPRPTAAATPAAPVVKRAPAAPRGRGPPSALQIIWPGQTTAGPTASAAKDAAQEEAAREQGMAALVQQEAEDRAAEKAMAKRQKKQTSAPQIEKNYRF